MLVETGHSGHLCFLMEKGTDCKMMQKMNNAIILCPKLNHIKLHSIILCITHNFLKLCDLE